MNDSWREYARYYFQLLWLPLTLFFVFIVAKAVWQIFGLPAPLELVEPVRQAFDTYGLPALFLVAVIEAMLLVGGYIPGGTVIFIAVMVSESLREAAITVAVGVVGLFCGHVLNYLLGRYWWYKLLVKFNLSQSIASAKKRLQRRGFITAFGTYWLSSVAAVLDTTAGVLRVSWCRFATYSFLFTTFWGVVFGVLAYVTGDAVLQPTGSEGSDFILLMIILILWIAGRIIWDAYKNTHST